jgi:hypothetical protein
LTFDSRHTSPPLYLDVLEDLGPNERSRKQNGKAAPWNNYSGVRLFPRSSQEAAMNGIIYLIGLIVVILAILSFFGLR